MGALLLVQMSGAPGAGKSTVAHAIGRRTGAVVLDHDVTKSALLEAGLAPGVAGRASYLTLRALVRSVLNQGISVVLDSPCYYQELLDAGLRMAEEAGACYRYVECVVEDLAELRRRLQHRSPQQSQIVDLTGARATDEGPFAGEELFREWIRNMKRPSHSYLRLDTSRPLVECLPLVFDFLDACRLDGQPDGRAGNA